MSEADSTPRRRPPTIDLTAKEVETGQPDSMPKSDADPASPAADNAVSGGRGGGSFFSRATPYAIGVVIGAVAAGAIVAGLWIAGFAPARETATPPGTAGTEHGGRTERKNH